MPDLCPQGCYWECEHRDWRAPTRFVDAEIRLPLTADNVPLGGGWLVAKTDGIYDGPTGQRVLPKEPA